MKVGMTDSSPSPPPIPTAAVSSEVRKLAAERLTTASIPTAVIRAMTWCDARWARSRGLPDADRMRRCGRVEVCRRQDIVGFEPLEGTSLTVLIGGVAQDWQAVVGEPYPAKLAFLADAAVGEGISTVQHPVIVDDDNLPLREVESGLVVPVREVVLLQAVESLA